LRQKCKLKLLGLPLSGSLWEGDLSTANPSIWIPEPKALHQSKLPRLIRLIAIALDHPTMQE
jgi:hypothetical protein